MNIQFATTNLLITQPPMFIGTTLKERRAILRTVFEATANFSISKKKKKKSNNPVKQTTPKTGILHEPTTQGRRSQRRNKKKKKRKSSKRIFSKICKRYLASSKSRSGPARVTNLSRASFLFFLYTSPPPPLPPPPRTKERREDWRGCRRPLRKIDSCFERETKEHEGRRRDERMDGAWESSGRHVPLAFDDWWRAAISAPRGNRFPSAGGGEDSSRPRSGCWPSRGFSPIYSRAGLKPRDDNLRGEK